MAGRQVLRQELLCLAWITTDLSDPHLQSFFIKEFPLWNIFPQNVIAHRVISPESLTANSDNYAFTDDPPSIFGFQL